MVKIQLKKGENIDNALKRFKRICNNEGIFSHAKRCSFYEKPSDRERRLEKERRKNMKKNQKLGLGFLAPKKRKKVKEKKK
jgi:small subunit ribosomal protein S21